MASDNNAIIYSATIRASSPTANESNNAENMHFSCQIPLFMHITHAFQVDIRRTHHHETPLVVSSLPCASPLEGLANPGELVSHAPYPVPYPVAVKWTFETLLPILYHPPGLQHREPSVLKARQDKRNPPDFRVWRRKIGVSIVRCVKHQGEASKRKFITRWSKFLVWTGKGGKSVLRGSVPASAQCTRTRTAT